MNSLDIWLLAVALAMDCFTVSIVSGVIVRRFMLGLVLRLAVFFGAFQALMPLIGWAIATSIDALAVGISFACIGYHSLNSLLWPLIVIGVVSFTFSVLGYMLGVRFGRRIERRLKPELLGGLILLVIGVKILLSHLFGIG